MYTVPSMSCRDRECTIQRILPFAGPIIAFLAMLVPMAIYAVPAMIA